MVLVLAVDVCANTGFEALHVVVDFHSSCDRDFFGFLLVFVQFFVGFDPFFVSMSLQFFRYECDSVVWL